MIFCWGRFWGLFSSLDRLLRTTTKIKLTFLGKKCTPDKILATPMAVPARQMTFPSVYNNNDSGSADLRHGEAVSGVCTRSPNSLSRVTFVLKFSWGPINFFQRYEPNCETCPIPQYWRILWKIPEFGSWSEWLEKVDQFFVVRRYICGRIFTKILSVVFTLTCVHTDKCGHYIHRYFLGGGKSLGNPL